MSTDQETSNKATFRRVHDATNSGDLGLISRTFDELVEPDVKILHRRFVSGRVAETWGVVDVFSQMNSSA
jgi:hypothetical protein